MVTLKMSTVDVLHAFMLPQLAGKRDLFQQRVNTLWFRADSSGYYSGQCAEFCGIQHGAMRFHVAATTPAEFDAFIAGLRRPRTPGGVPAAPAPAAAATDTTASMGGQAGGQGGRGADGQIGAGAQAPAGQTQEQPPIGPAPSDSTSPAGQGAKLFVQRGCPACHVLDATSKAKMVGPNLANVGSRRYIGAGVALNNDENLARWIQNPHDMKVGVTMPNMGLTSEQARAVAAFLRTLK
jgi:cytochrome c oxidase subunit 2